MSLRYKKAEIARKDTNRTVKMRFAQQTKTSATSQPAKLKSQNTRAPLHKPYTNLEQQCLCRVCTLPRTLHCTPRDRTAPHRTTKQAGRPRSVAPALCNFRAAARAQYFQFQFFPFSPREYFQLSVISMYKLKIENIPYLGLGKN